MGSEQKDDKKKKEGQDDFLEAHDTEAHSRCGLGIRLAASQKAQKEKKMKQRKRSQKEIEQISLSRKRPINAKHSVPCSSIGGAKCNLIKS